MNTLLLIDGNNFYTRGYFVAKHLNKNILEFIFEMLFNLFKIYNGKKKIIFVFDTEKSKRRLALYPAYKATRKTSLSPEDYIVFKELMKNFIDLITFFGYSSFYGDGFEGDDFIAYFSNQLKIKYKIVIISTDKDLYQLISKYVIVYDPIKSIHLTIDNFEGIMEIPLKYYLDYKIMIGDSSDNIDGIPGIGDVRAKTLIKTFGGINSIIDNLSKREQVYKYERNLIENLSTIELNKQLIDLSFYFKDMEMINSIKHQLTNRRINQNEFMLLASSLGLYDLYKRLKEVDANG